MTVSAAIRLNGGSAGVKASVSASSTVTGTLDSITGVRSVEWLIASTDETSEPSDYTLLQSGIVGETVTFTALGAGTAGILFSRVNNGIDPVTGNYSTAMTSTVKFYVPASANGFEVGCVNETFESDPTYGSTGEINTGIRNAAPIAGVPATRQVIAGAGLTGGGALSGDVTLNVIANADGSIVVNANDIQVGVLASDVQHGNLGGGNLHDDVVASGASGFMSGADKAKLDGVGAAAPPGTRTLTAGAGLTGGGDLSADRTFDVVANADGSIVVNANDIQVGVINDTQHGSRGGGSLHANAVASGAAGFLTGSDKAKLDALSTTAGVINYTWGSASMPVSGNSFPTPGYDNVAATTNEIKWTVDKPFTATGMRYRARVGGSGAPTIDVKLLKNGSATGFGVNGLASNATTGSNTGSVAFAAGDDISIQFSPSGTLDTSPSGIVVTVGVTT